MEKTTRKSVAKRWTLIAVIAFALIAIIGGTFARYTSSEVNEAEIEVAKWAVKMTADNGVDVLNSTEPITFTVKSNTNVVPGKIAPAVTAEAIVELDLTGTEVAVDFSASINKDELTNLGLGDRLTITSEFEGTSYTPEQKVLIPLVGNAAFTSENGKKQIKLIVTWTNADNQEARDDDTAIGEAAPTTLTIPVTFTAEQHIDNN